MQCIWAIKQSVRKSGGAQWTEECGAKTSRLSIKIG